MSEQAGRYQRSAGGLIGAMAVLVLLLVGWVLVRGLFRTDPGHPVAAVDYAREVPAVRRAADFHVLAPPRLPAGWRATTVGWTDAPEQHWHLGVLTDRDRYVGLEQGTAPLSAQVARYVDEQARRGAPVDVAGRTWSTYTDATGDLALARREGKVTTLVVGHDVPRSDLLSYVSSLR